jgi:alkaline phosphatase D
MMTMRNTVIIALLTLTCATAQAQVDPNMAPFYHGVASGDALADRVIIWTRVTPTDINDSYEVDWEMATDESMTTIVASGSYLTDASEDFTVKVDVTGLTANTWYWYRFNMEGSQSLIGRTRTAPNTMVDRLRFAVVSCQNFGGGLFYNAYNEMAQRDDLDAVIHLGDYIYEYAASLSGNGIEILPPNETVSLSDYRQRYASYRLDANLREVHRKWPFYNVWDDHESANNSWGINGAQNHQPDTEGPWAERLANSKKAYFEWIPIRPKAPANYSIYRTIPMGPLVDLIMIDTRIEGRDQEVGATDPAIDDPNRTMLGATQKQWLKEQLSGSSAQWKIIGNQVMFAPLELPAIPIIFPNGGIINADQWDGYRAEREEMVEFLHSNSIDNVVVLTGDIHTSWGNDIPHHDLNYDPNTGEGSVGVEFVTTSITSGSSPVNVGASIISAANPHMKYVDLAQKGYVILDVDQQRTKGHWVYVSSVSSAEYTVSETDALVTISGQNFLRPESALSTSNLNPIPSSLSLQLYPNPTDGVINLKIGTAKDAMLFFELYDVMGRQLTSSVLGTKGAGEHRTSIDMATYPAGLYMVRLLNGDSEATSALFFRD